MRDLYAQLMKAKGYGQGPTESEEEAAGEDEEKSLPETSQGVAAEDDAEKAVPPVMGVEGVMKSIDQIAEEMLSKMPLLSDDGSGLNKAMNSAQSGEILSGADLGHMKLSASGQASSGQQFSSESSTGMPSPEAGSEVQFSDDDDGLVEGDPHKKPLAQSGGGAPDLASSARQDMDGPKGGELGSAPGLSKGYVVNGQVYVGGGLDDYIAKAMGDGDHRDGARIQEEPTFALHNTPLMKSRGCSCGARHPTMFTSCPECGRDHFGRPDFGPSVVMSKSVAERLTPPDDGDVVYPGGFLTLE